MEKPSLSQSSYITEYISREFINAAEANQTDVFMEKLNELQKWFEKKLEISYVVTVSEVIKRFNFLFNTDYPYDMICEQQGWIGMTNDEKKEGVA